MLVEFCTQHYSLTCYHETFEHSFFSAAKLVSILHQIKKILIINQFIVTRSLDQAIILLKELQDWKEISIIAHKACQLFQEHGSPDTAALLLDKSAKMIEPHLPEDALILYKYYFTATFFRVFFTLFFLGEQWK